MSTHAIFRAPDPFNEPVRDYAPGSPEREALRLRLKEMETQQLDIPLVVGGEEGRTGSTFEAVQPHKRSHVLATVHKGGAKEVERAVAAAADAWNDWSRTPWEDRAAIFLRAAELLAGPWRPTLNAATMLGQSKTAHQAEIDSACEVIDFWRFNVSFMTRIYEEQPVSSPGVWNRLEYRPLEGFVFNGMWKTVGENLAAGAYRNYPRIVGETGGKDFIVAHPSADVESLATAIVRGSFEYQGQKCSAASRVFAPSNLWPELRERLVEQVRALKVGNVSDFGNFMGAVIDGGSFETQKAAIDEANTSNGNASVLVGGHYD